MAEKTTPKAASAVPASPATPKTCRVYNRSDRSFLHDGHRLAPRAFLDVPVAVAELWLKMFENDVVEAGVAQKELNGLASENAELKARIAELEAKLKAAEAAV